MQSPKLPVLSVCAVVLATLAFATGCGSTDAPDAGPLDATPDAGLVVDTGQAPADTGTIEDAGHDAGTTDDAGSVDDAGTMDDAGISDFPTLADYIVCEIDTDCPVGLGQCVKELTFNRAVGGGETTIAISDLDSRLSTGQGVCSEACTRDLSACETMSLRDPTGALVPFTCQVVALGASAYHATPPAYPFGDTLDFTEMSLGQPFAALCRPPFELDEDRSPSFCAACDEDSACQQGTCWRFETNAPIAAGESGVCLETTTDSCPIGFEVRALQDGGTSLGDHCVPIEETCGPCLDLFDRDDDLRGAGHCQNVQVDCDDRNLAAYYDNLDPEHPFPTHCGVQDYNCNGLADDSEEVGVEAYLAFHCEYCGDDFHGQTINAGTNSEAVLECANAVMRVASCTDADQVHCSGDPRQVGCEATAATGGPRF